MAQQPLEPDAAPDWNLDLAYYLLELADHAALHGGIYQQALTAEPLPWNAEEDHFLRDLLLRAVTDGGVYQQALAAWYGRFEA